MDEYVIVAGRKLRKGYTTGTCAAAASKAAVSMIVTGKLLEKVNINTPSGISLELQLNDVQLQDGIAQCSVIKDGGDDPDVTTGLKIFARAELTEDGQIVVKGGEGIGTVTLPGLKVEVGMPAINPVPMKMIRDAAAQLLPDGKGVIITLKVPGGEEIAKKTYNPKLGIVGGISIIGTKGIVEPMSEDAWKEALALELSVLAQRGLRECVFAFGNYGEDFATNDLKIQKHMIIKVSNFLGFMLDKAVESGIERILLAGHLGKLVKVAGGIFHTHSRVADARMEILSAYAGLEGASTEVIRNIYSCKTTGEAADIIDGQNLIGIYKRIAENASKRCIDHTYEKIVMGTALFNEENRLLYIDEAADKIIKGLKG